MTPRNCLLATTHFPITRYNKRKFIFQLSFCWEVSETSSFMRQRPLELKQQGRESICSKYFSTEEKELFSYLYIHALPFLQLILFFYRVKSCISKKAGYQKHSSVKVCCLIFTRESRAHRYYHCSHMASTTDPGKEQIDICRAFVNHWYPGFSASITSLSPSPHFIDSLSIHIKKRGIANTCLFILGEVLAWKHNSCPFSTSFFPSQSPTKYWTLE